MLPLFFLFLLLAIPACACQNNHPSEEVITSPVIRLGADRLFDDYRHLVAGKRVGLITNHSAVIGRNHLADLLHRDPDISLSVLFGPEHGIRGLADAGEDVDHSVDPDTGLPVYSLYGPITRPTMEMLERVDVLLFDIQDVGARFYTYVITMGRAMISAAEADISFIVLDRPNPLGGVRMEGPLLEEAYHSGIGIYPTPVTHGMTVGELATMIQGEAWHEGLESLELHIVPMEGWQRTMLWHETGLEWVPPSPNIPDYETALVYPGSCLFEATRASEGRGTRTPFLLTGSPFIDSQIVANDLNGRQLPGLRFDAVRFIPESITGMSTRPKLEGEMVHGVRISVTDPVAVRPVEAGIHLLESFYQQLPEVEKDRFFLRRGLEIRIGNERVRQQIEQGVPAGIIADWQADIDQFSRQRQPYLIYN